MTPAPRLLPDRLPVVAGVELAATHLPGVEPCCDWYDVIARRDGTIGMAIADVAGRGAHAAELAERLRHGFHEHTLAGDGPGAVVAHVNDLVTDVGTEMSTLMALLFTPSSGELRGANAGHLPALIRRTGGTVERWDAARSLPLGVVAHALFPEDCVHLGPGDAVLVYTDGLIERRGALLEETLDELERAVPVFGSADAVRTAVLEATLAEGGHDDDVAVVTLGVPAEG